MSRRLLVGKVDQKLNATFANVARMIGDERLQKPLRDIAVYVETEVHNAAFNKINNPNAESETRKDIKRLKTEAQRFEAALNRVSKHFLELTFDLHKEVSAAKLAARGVAASCNKWLSRPNKGGRPRLPGRVTCALALIEGWIAVHNSAPGHNNPKLQAACDEYWRACAEAALQEKIEAALQESMVIDRRRWAGEMARVFGLNKTADWSNHIESAKKTQSKMRDSIRREIREGLTRE